MPSKRHIFLGRCCDDVLSVHVTVAGDTAYQFLFPIDNSDHVSDMTIVLATHAVLFTLMDQLNRISMVQLVGMPMSDPVGME